MKIYMMDGRNIYLHICKKLKSMDDVKRCTGHLPWQEAELATNRHEHKLLQKVAARNNIMHVHALESSSQREKRLIGRERQRGLLTGTTRRKRQPAGYNNAWLKPDSPSKVCQICY
jgi:hypothetical protein